MNTKIHNRIQIGKGPYYANSRLLGSKLITRNTKIKMYKILIRPVVSYGVDTWTMTKKEQVTPRRFERKVVRLSLIHI